MVKLRQVNSPASRAAWTEPFYSGELKVVNGETETDNPEWINQLRGRGYVIVEEETEEVPQSEGVSEFATVPEEDAGEVYVEQPFVPLSTQTVDEIAEVPSENEVMAGETATASDVEAPVTDAEGNVQVGVDESAFNDDVPHSESVVATPSRSRRKKE